MPKDIEHSSRIHVFMLHSIGYWYVFGSSAIIRSILKYKSALTRFLFLQNLIKYGSFSTQLLRTVNVVKIFLRALMPDGGNWAILLLSPGFEPNDQPCLLCKAH